MGSSLSVPNLLRASQRRVMPRILPFKRHKNPLTYLDNAVFWAQDLSIKRRQYFGELNLNWTFCFR